MTELARPSSTAAVVDSSMLTLTQAGIARLAGVSRNTVSSWRARFSESSETPFPQPLHAKGSLSQDLFLTEDVCSWLNSTNRSHGRDINGDAPYYSTLFDSLLEDCLPAVGPLVHFSQHGDWPENADSALIDKLVTLSEAAFGPYPLLRRLREFLSQNFSESLGHDARNTLTATLHDYCAWAKPLTFDSISIAASTPASFCLLADTFADASFAEDITVYVPREVLDGYHAFVDNHSPDSTNNPLDQVLSFIALAELECLGVHLTPFEPVDGDLPADCLVVHINTAARQDPHDYFGGLDLLLLPLSELGGAIVVGPASLLTESTSRSAKSARREFLSATETGAVAPLRYSARLPRHWTPRNGQLQPAIWVFRRSRKSEFPVAVADHSGMTSHDNTLLAENLATALTDPDSFPYKALWNAKVFVAPAIWRKDEVAPGPLRTEPSSMHRAKSQASSSTHGIPTVGDLWAQADQLGLDTSSFNFQDFEAGVGATNKPRANSKRALTIPWDLATRRGEQQVLSVRSGTKFKETDVTPASSLSEDITSGIGIVGTRELHSPKNPANFRLASNTSEWTNRTISIFDLSDKYPRATLTEPGDVIVLALKA